ncbi:MAG: hypothetical protein DCC52_19040 [Chloroflexi bacterium]|nr:MAG: hypothetical protein DCC52_19040 [Chloroflexota bacterium]
MEPKMSPRIIRVGAVAAFVAALLLALQFVIALGIGNDFALMSKALDPARMIALFQAHADALTQLMAADDAFAVAYALAFIALALYLMPRAKLLASIALGLALATTLTDWAENSLTLVAVQSAVQTQTLDANILRALLWLGQMKYLLIYPAAILFAVGVWDEGRASVVDVCAVGSGGNFSLGKNRKGLGL